MPTHEVTNPPKIHSKYNLKHPPETSQAPHKKKLTNASATRAVVIGEVPTLTHEVRYDPVELAPPVPEALLVGA